MKSKESGRIAAITGANGYVGSIISTALADAGFSIRRLIRRPVTGSNDQHYEITGALSPDLLDGVDLLIHCAYDFSVRTRADVWAANVYGTRSLLDLAAASQVRRTIVVSSMSAFSGTRQIYGRAKLASEIDAFSRNMYVVRPGLVYGPGWGGMAGILRRLTSLPIVPLVGQRAHQFTLHEVDLRNAIAILANADDIPSRPLGLAHPDPVPFEYLMRRIAEANGKQTVRFVPVPWMPAYAAVRAVEFSRLNLSVRADSLLGLIRSADSVPNPMDLRKLGVEFRPFDL